MLRRILVIFLIGGFLIAACSKSEATQEKQATEAYPVPPTLSPTSGEPYPVVEYSFPLFGTPMTFGDEELYPAPGDSSSLGEEDMIRGEVFLEGISISVFEDGPLIYALELSGSLPTPCHVLRVIVSEPVENDRIEVEAYTLLSPGSICTQVLEPFEEQIPLGSYFSGSYTVWVNGEKVGEISPEIK